MTKSSSNTSWLVKSLVENISSFIKIQVSGCTRLYRATISQFVLTCVVRFALKIHYTQQLSDTYIKANVVFDVQMTLCYAKMSKNRICWFVNKTVSPKLNVIVLLERRLSYVFFSTVLSPTDWLRMQLIRRINLMQCILSSIWDELIVSFACKISTCLFLQ